MNKSIFIIAFSILTTNACSQSQKPVEKFNFGFENTSLKQKLPDKWFIWGSGYSLSTDSRVIHSGQNSVLIEPAENRIKDSFGCAAYSIPASYDCKEIELRAYMKLEDVSEGTIGLMLRIDGPSGILKFDNMMNRNLTGSADWTQYSVMLPYPRNARIIYIGAILSGKGKLWIDDFELLLDGISIEKVTKAEQKQYKADLDKEFDNGSNIGAIAPTERNLKDLKTLGLIWGFLKYYHPSVTDGNFNWDFELFRIFPGILNSKNTAERDAILTVWINKLGQFEQASEIKISPEKIKITPDLGWIANSGFSEELESLLLKVKNAARSGYNYYVGQMPGAGNPDFSNEKPYSAMKFPDTGYRILSLYRYWNMIQYWFPYKNLIEEDWKNVLEEFIPEMLEVNSEAEYALTLLEIIARIHDTHADIYGGTEAINKYLGVNYSAVELGFIENKAVVTGFYNELKGNQTGLILGDVITKVNNRRIEDIVKERLNLTPASNYSTQLRDIATSLLRTNDTIVRIEFSREGIVGDKILKAYPQNQVNVYKRYQIQDTSFKFIGKDIAYINNGTLKRAHVPGIWDAMKGSKGLIIDIRNYPSDFPIYELSGYLMPEKTPFVKFTTGSIFTPGLFTFGDTLISVGHGNNDYFKGKICILVNELSASSAEFHAMAYRAAPGAVVIGSTTSAADGNVSEIYLPGGIRTMISGIGVYYPDGRETQRVGIVPDIEVKPTIAGIKAGKDEVLEKAIEIINKE